MSVYKFATSSGVRYRVNVRDPDGSWYEQRVFERKTDAVNYEAECIQKKKKGALAVRVEERGLTVKEYFDNKWARLCRGGVSQGWRDSQDQMFEDHIAPAIGQKRFAGIQKADVLEVFNAAEKKGLGPQMRLHIYNLLHKMFDDSINTFELRESNPVLRKFKPGVPEVEQAFLPPPVALKFLDYCKKDPYGPAVWLMVWAGLRSGELQALRWGSILFASNEIILTEQWVRKERRVGPLKNDKPVRLPMTEPLAEYLLSIRPLDWDRADLILRGKKTGGVADHRSIWLALRRLCKDFGTQPLSAHGFRHTCGALWKSQGASRADLKILFNHSSETSTQRYMHDVPDRLTNIASKFSRPVPAKKRKKHLSLV